MCVWCVCSEAVGHGINTMITALYFCWRADLVSQSSDAWASATDEYSDMDGPTSLRDRLSTLRWLYIVLVSYAGCISCWCLVL